MGNRYESRTKVYQIDFEPIGNRTQCPHDQSLLETAHQAGIHLISLCGGVGTCGRCKVQVLKGKVSPPTLKERESIDHQELHQGFRLACRIFPKSDLLVHVPPESLSTPQRVQVEGLEAPLTPDPFLDAYKLVLPPPSFSDLRADDVRLIESLKEQHSVDCQRGDMEVLKDLSPRLRSQDWTVQATMRGPELIAISPWPSPKLGLAVDLGTTKVAGYLLDLDNGRTLAAKGAMNPQIAYGEDVITRMNTAARTPENAKQMQGLASEALDQLAVELTDEIGAKPEDIVEVVVVGNTAIHHLLLRLPVAQLARAPHVPAVHDAIDVKARDVGVHISSGGYMHLLPNIAGFVGADHVAMLLSTEVWKTGGLTLAMDIGTNTEICLADHGGMTSVSCASGPAFEGAHIKWGMRAGAGAIEYLRLVDERIEYQTIDGAAPIGICGSGILDTLAQLYLAGVVDQTGRMKEGHPRVVCSQKEREFVLVSQEERNGGSAITITQKDIRQLQLAKAAIRAGLQILLEASGHAEDELDHVIIAGAFGSYLDISSAITMGMLPRLPMDRFRQVGNAAGAGARAALVSKSKRAEARDIARKVRYVELASVPSFRKTFMQAISIDSF